MKICLINNLFPPIESGSSRFTFELAMQLSKRGHEVTVISTRFDDFHEFEIINGVHIYRLKGIRLPRVKLAHNFKWFALTVVLNNRRLLTSIIKERNIQILHLNGHIFDIGFHAVYIKKRFKIPLVLTIHTSAGHPNTLFNLILKVLDKKVAKPLIIDHCDFSIAPDINIKKYICERFGDQKVSIIPYGIDLNSLQDFYNETILDRYNLRSKNYILSLGHVHALRTREDLICAMPDVLKEFPNIYLVIAGEIYMDKTTKLVESLNISKNVIFTGSVSHKEALALIRNALIEAHWGNFFSGGLGIASLEAMAFGKPVMATPREDLLGKQIIKNWENIVIAQKNKPREIAKDLIKLIKNETLRKKIGNNARNIITKNFAWEVVCPKIENIYRSLISNAH